MDGLKVIGWFLLVCIAFAIHWILGLIMVFFTLVILANIFED